MKQKLKNIILIGILVFATIIGIYYGYINVNANTTKRIEMFGQPAEYFTNTGTITHFVTEHKGCMFDNKTMYELGIRNILGQQGYSLPAGEFEDNDKKKYSDVFFRAGACLYHQQSTIQGSGFEIRDFIEINEEGTKILHYNKSANAVESYNINMPDGCDQILAYLMKLITEGEENKPTEKYNDDGKVQNTNLYIRRRAMRAFFKNYFSKYISGYVNELFYVEGDIFDTDAKGNDVYDDAVKKLGKNVSFTKLTASSNAIANDVQITDAENNIITKTYYGPFKMKYGGRTLSTSAEYIHKIYGYNESTTVEFYIKDESGKFKKVDPEETSLSEVEFYITTPADIMHHKEITFKSKVFDAYKARMFLMVSPYGGAQQQIVFEGKEIKDVTDKITFYLGDDTTEKLKIKKVDKDGQALALSGIKFAVYDSNNNLKGTLITKSDGTTDEWQLDAGIYTIIETENNYYGYKGNVGQQMTVYVEDGKTTEVKFKNVPETRNLEIIKQNKNNRQEKLKNVEYYLQRIINGKTEYARLKNASGTIISSIEPSTEEVTIATNNVASDSLYRIEWVSKRTDATIFKTDSNGKIKINNLEVYYYLNKKITYGFREKYNPNYGYKGNSGEIAKSELDTVENYTTSIPHDNESSLGNIAIYKMEEGTDRPVSGIVFIIRNKSERIYSIKK